MRLFYCFIQAKKNPKEESCTDSRTDFPNPSKNDTVVLRHHDEVQADLSAGVVLGIIWREDDAVRARVLTATGCCKRKSDGITEPGPIGPSPAASRSAHALRCCAVSAAPSHDRFYASGTAALAASSY